MRTASYILIASLAMMVATVAPAASGEDVAIPLNLADLDLTKASDQARLEARVARAAGAACLDPGRQGTRAHAEYIRCKTAAVTKAQATARTMIAAAAQRGEAKVRLAERR